MCEHLLTESETALKSSTALPSDISRVISTIDDADADEGE